MERLTPTDSETRSADIVAANLEQLQALFPEAWTEGRLDLEVLKQLLGGVVEEREEKYGLTWHGKRQARQLALTPSTGTLRPAPEDSVDWNTTQNLMIEGDNLEVLKLLQKSYAGKVKLIYIDPPYNTGKDFVYPDNFQDSMKNYLELTGQVEGGAKVSSNTEASGRFHTDWLNMMSPRLRLARSMLCPDGLVCVSIDDNEMHNARHILDEVFGSESFVGVLTWITTTQPDNIGRARFGLQQNIEYVLVYSRCPRLDLPAFLLRSSGNSPSYPHVGRFGPCRFEIIERAFEGAYARPTMRFKILGQDPREGKQWQIGEAQARDLELRGRVELVDGMVKRAVYPEDESDKLTGLIPFWAHLKDVRTSQAGKAELSELLGQGHGVDTVKPLSLLAEILSHLPSDTVCLDFFAGTGTTAHAVFQANSGDAGTRKFVLVQLPEPFDQTIPRQRNSAEFCDSIGRPRNMAEITKERLRRAAMKVKEENPLFAGDLGFRVFKLDSSNLRTWDPATQDLDAGLLEAVDHLKSGRTEQDVLYELLLKLGLDLCVPIEQRQAGAEGRHTVHSVGGGVLMACLSEAIARDEVDAIAAAITSWHDELTPAGDTTCVFRDTAFGGDDVAKTNLSETLKQHGIKQVLCL